MILLPPVPVAAAVQEAGIPAEHAAQAARAQAMVDRLEGGDKTSASLAAARALREECLAAGNHRSAEFLAGHIVAAFPDQLSDHHRYAEILLVRGNAARAEATLRDLVKERPTDCAAYGMLSDLLVEEGRPEEAMGVQAAHLREHAGEAGPLHARASIALWELRDPAAARAEAAIMRAGAERPGIRRNVADWLRERAASIEENATRREKDREALRAASARLDRFLWGTVLGFALALGLAGWTTRHRS